MKSNLQLQQAPKGVYEKVSLPEIMAYNQQFNDKYATHTNSLEHINIVGI